MKTTYLFNTLLPNNKLNNGKRPKTDAFRFIFAIFPYTKLIFNRFAIFINIALLSTFNTPSKAQVMEPVRLEFPARIDVPAYNIELLGENGLMLFYESTEKTDEGKRKWYFSYRDTSLKEDWLQYVALSDGLLYHSTQSTSKQSVLLFTSIESKKSTTSTYELLRFDLESNHFQLIGGKLPEKATVSGFSTIANKVLLGVNLPDYQSDLLIYDLANGSVKSIVHDIDGQSVIQSISCSPKTELFIVAIKRFDNNKYVEDVFMVFNQNGELTKKWTFNNENKYLQAMAIYLVDPEKVIIVGSYDENSKIRTTVKEAANSPELTLEAKGMFFLSFQGEAMLANTFYDFNKLSNIYNVLPTDELISARQKQSRSGSTNPENTIVFQLFHPQLQHFSNQYIYTAEAFKPQYRIETRMDYDYYGRLVPYTYRVFEGYQSFSALIASFDDKGAILWSNDFEMRDVLSPQLRENVTIRPDSTGIVAAMLQNGILSSKIIGQNGNQVGQTEQTKIENLFTNDRLQEENFSNISWWYDQYYLATGYQRISNNRLRTNNPRSVFYIQKLVFE